MRKGIERSRGRLILKGVHGQLFQIKSASRKFINYIRNLGDFLFALREKYFLAKQENFLPSPPLGGIRPRRGVKIVVF